MARKREMDNLAKDASRALAAGMSYGRWKPFYPHTKDDEIVAPDPNTKPCELCGKPMNKGGRRKKYCSEECAHRAKIMRDSECKQRLKEQKQTPNGDANI